MPQVVEPKIRSTVHEMPVQVRAATLNPATFRADDNTVDVTWTTGSRVRRYDIWSDTVYEEELDLSPGSVDMTRFDAGVVQVLDGHDVSGGVQAILGRATRGWIEGGEGGATLQLSQRPELAGVVGDIRAGIIRAISFGYSVLKYQITPADSRDDGGTVPLYRAVLWQPQEISFVTVPADPNAGTRAQFEQLISRSQGVRPCEFIRADAQPSEDPTMTEAELQAQREREQQEAATRQAAAEAEAQRVIQAANARAADITQICTRHGVGELATELVRTGATVDVARSAVLEELARRDVAAGGHRNVSRVQTVTDEAQTRIAGMEEAVLHRLSSRSALTDNGRQFRGMSLLELCRDHLQAQGVNTRGMDRMTLAATALSFRSPGMMTTSDFVNLFGNVARKRLRDAYKQQPTTYQVWARRGPDLPDFKPTSIVALSGAPDLLKVNEHGEFKYGAFADAGESYRLLTYGRIVALTRQALINDDLRAFDRLIAAFGDSASRLENAVVYAELLNNANLADGNALFSTAHGNLATGAGSALSFTSLFAARQAMRTQKGLSGDATSALQQINVVPRFLIVPAALETVAYQLTSPAYTAQVSGTSTLSPGTNDFAPGGRTSLTVVVEPLLDANSTTAWYLATDNGSIDTVEYAFLDGNEGPVIESQNGFDVDGTEWKCREDFGAKAADWRGLYKSVGA